MHTPHVGRARLRLLLFAATLAVVSDTGAQSGYSGQPYQGRPQAIPGRVEMERYDTGGQGVAYDDTDAVNNGSGKLNTGESAVDRFRQDEGVDLSFPHDEARREARVLVGCGHVGVPARQVRAVEQRHDLPGDEGVGIGPAELT